MTTVRLSRLENQTMSREQILEAALKSAQEQLYNQKRIIEIARGMLKPMSVLKLDVELAKLKEAIDLMDLQD